MIQMIYKIEVKGAIIRIIPYEIYEVSVMRSDFLGNLPKYIEFKEIGDTITLVMNKYCTTSNMQENNAAFEAWSLYLISLGYRKVILSESEPNTYMTANERVHYNRFLYRALRFEDGFSWFTLTPGLRRKTQDFKVKILSCKDLYVNAPIMPYKLDSELGEAKVERMLIRDDMRNRLNKLLNSNVDKFHLQLPASLFIGDVVGGKEVFPRGGARIDIWGLDGSTFNMIELKVGSNKNLGVISQTFFYACFVYEMYCLRHLERKDPQGIRQYYSGKAERGYFDLVRAKIKTVNAHFLLENKHKYFDAAFEQLQKFELEGIKFNYVQYPIWNTSEINLQKNILYTSKSMRTQCAPQKNVAKYTSKSSDYGRTLKGLQIYNTLCQSDNACMYIGKQDIELKLRRMNRNEIDNTSFRLNDKPSSKSSSWIRGDKFKRIYENKS